MTSEAQEITSKQVSSLPKWVTEARKTHAPKSVEVESIDGLEGESKTEIRVLNSCEELGDFLEEEIKKAKIQIDECFSNRIEEIRVKAEKVKTIRSVLKKIAGAEIMAKPEEHEIELMGLKVIVNPDPEWELDLYEKAGKSLQEKIKALQGVKEACEPMSDLEDDGKISITIVLNNNVPNSIVLNI